MADTRFDIIVPVGFGVDGLPLDRGRIEQQVATALTARFGVLLVSESYGDWRDSQGNVKRQPLRTFSVMGMLASDQSWLQSAIVSQLKPAYGGAQVVLVSTPTTVAFL